MTRTADAVSDRLLQLGELIQTNITQLIESRRAVTATGNGTEPSDLPPWSVFNAQRALQAATGSLTELISQPENRLLEVSSQYFEARALHIAADARIPDLLAKTAPRGVPIDLLSAKAGIESRKLSRLLRCLCSIHIFTEVEPDVFANNAVSAGLVDNEPLRAYILLLRHGRMPWVFPSPDGIGLRRKPARLTCTRVTMLPFRERLTRTPPHAPPLVLPVPGARGGDAAAASPKTPYPGVFGTELSRVVNSGVGDGQPISRPEHAIFSLAMVGGGRVFGRAHLHAYVAGGFCLQLSHLYPNLKFVLQDRGPAIEKAQNEVWPRENPAALAAGRIRFVVHDFFEKNPVPEADVYWLRYVLHDWSDDYCVRILSGIRQSMGPRSRILICDQVMNTTHGCSDLPPAPEPLLPNWGYYTRYSHQRDLAMMAIINGIERKPDEFRELVERAGLRLRKIWDCRSQVGLVEVVLPNSEL
ncbi:conserved hypothetical protein [Verticillium alfalfae VaMs.102]|uniref:Uncharacterized protein n=1 Tax=Verticillium alfalfae (strain VaMs.102 / ATCC MYA-4576 / FGSC 10136) TaxID=526221 RepID=C9SY21_VERA1|nr:conserved hypothetical protein [Verticillium alfalfae VaMs.102]EEY23686.1 conserved hypothetical protein [Verticillium alfalfae VaMs.102]